jgi:transcription elongation factor Elf1
MNAFNVEYRKMLSTTVVCPRCKATNIPNASETIEIDQTGTRAFCTNCTFERPVEAFLPKEK